MSDDTEILAVFVDDFRDKKRFRRILRRILFPTLSSSGFLLPPSRFASRRVLEARLPQLSDDPFRCAELSFVPPFDADCRRLFQYIFAAEYSGVSVLFLWY